MIHLATQQDLIAFSKIEFQRRKSNIQPHPQTHAETPHTAQAHVPNVGAMANPGISLLSHREIGWVTSNF